MAVCQGRKQKSQLSERSESERVSISGDSLYPLHTTDTKTLGLGFLGLSGSAAGQEPCHMANGSLPGEGRGVGGVVHACARRGQPARPHLKGVYGASRSQVCPPLPGMLTRPFGACQIF